MQNYKTIDEYIEMFPDDVKVKLENIRQTVKKLVPDAIETISYGIPTFKLNGNLVHFAGYKTHIGFYPTSSGIEYFKKELKGYDTSRGTIKFELDKPLPINLITKIVKFKIIENQKRKAVKK